MITSQKIEMKDVNKMHLNSCKCQGLSMQEESFFLDLKKILELFKCFRDSQHNRHFLARFFSRCL